MRQPLDVLYLGLEFMDAAARRLWEAIGRPDGCVLFGLTSFFRASHGLELPPPVRALVDEFRQVALANFGSVLVRPGANWCTINQILAAAAAACCSGATPADFLAAAGNRPELIYRALESICITNTAWYLDRVVGSGTLAAVARHGSLYVISPHSRARHIMLAEELEAEDRAGVIDVIMRSGPVAFMHDMMEVHHSYLLSDEEFKILLGAFQYVTDTELYAQLDQYAHRIATADARGADPVHGDNSCRSPDQARLAEVFAYLAERIDANTRSEIAVRILVCYANGYLKRAEANALFGVLTREEREASVAFARERLRAIEDGRADALHWSVGSQSSMLATWVQ